MIQQLETLPAPVTAAFQRFHEHCTKRQLSQADAAKLLVKPDGTAYDTSSVSRIFRHKWEGNTENIVAAIDRALLINAAEFRKHKFPFVETSTVRTIWNYIDIVRDTDQHMGLIIGDSQSTKSRSTVEYKLRRPKEDIIHYQFVEDGHKSYVIGDLCELRSVSLKYNTAARAREFAKTITEETVLILDEIQQCASREKAGGRMSAERINTLEYFRRLRDTTGCTVIYLGTTEALDMMEGKKHGCNNGNILLQTLRRSIPTLKLKSKPNSADLNAFAAKIGLPSASTNSSALTFQKDTIEKSGLGVWLMYLQMGQKLARAQRHAFSWNDVLEADAIFLNAGDEE